MKAYVYVLALLFFTITNGQMITFTGGGGSGNNSVSNPMNWSPVGVPNANSIVYINDTSCSGGCTVLFDEDMVVAELHINSTSGSVTVQVNGANLTVTNAFAFGNPYTNSYIYLEILGGGIFEIGESCVASIYPSSGSYEIYGNDLMDNWFINKGAVTVLGSADTTSADTVYISAYSSGTKLSVASWGSWNVPDSKVYLSFYGLDVLNVYGGSFDGSWITTTEVSITFEGTDVVLQAGAGGDATGTGAVSFKYVNFDSSRTQYNTYIDPPPNALIFNTTGVTVADAQFSGTNIVFLYDGWLMNCNITDYAMVNSSSTVSGVHAYFIGDNNNIASAIFAGIGTDFIIQVEYLATLTMTSDFSLYGSVTLINNGTWVYDSSSTLYWDAAAYWINLGVLSVINHDNDYIQGSTFPGITSTLVGTMVNMGTIELLSGGGINYNAGTGTFRQCKNGIVKFKIGGSDESGRLLLAEVIMGGYIGVNFDSATTISSFGESLGITWKTPADAIPTGNVKYIAKGPGLIDTDTTQILCWTISNNVLVYDITDEVVCPTDQYQLLPALNPLDACDDLPANIKNLQDLASCPATAGCGSIDTGTPSGGNPPGSAANVNVASLAFLVSLICLFLKF